jgi:Sulfotransferase domain
LAERESGAERPGSITDPGLVKFRSGRLRMSPPDFVVAGAPKCGTTAIYKTLQRHPQIFLPSIKEPHYFAFEFKHRRAVETAASYDRLFWRASDSQLCGDGSVMYLSSTEAIPALIRRRPDVKVIVSVRDPVEMFISWHNQCLKNLDEDVEDPELAWRMQANRAAGQQPPKLCFNPKALEYRSVCSVGAQLQRMADLVPAAQRLILVYDDIEQNPRASYKRILDFLGVQDDQRGEFLRENSYARPRSVFRARAARAVQTHPILKKVRLSLKPFLNRHEVYFVERFFQSNLAPFQKPGLSEQFRRELRAEFSADTLILENLLGRDLSEWRNGRATVASASEHTSYNRVV